MKINVQITLGVMHMKKFKPDFLLNSYEEIDGKWLSDQNIKCILSDLDGTLAAWNDNGDEELERWLGNLKKNGVKLIVVSNNEPQRVQEFSTIHSVEGHSNCRKPYSGYIAKQAFFEDIDKKTTLFLGDQLFTDVWCGKKIGVKTALVKPLGDYEPLRTSCKRFLERMILGKW